MKYRIRKINDGYLVERKLLWKWHKCKIEVFYGCGTIVYSAIFETEEEAQKYIDRKKKRKSTNVNSLITGHLFYNE